jgi:uncharacterized short protein YbdD (DUF466 family)
LRRYCLCLVPVRHTPHPPRLVAGAPDYERYLAHVRRCHPQAVPLTRDAYARDRERARYDRPGARCC